MASLVGSLNGYFEGGDPGIFVDLADCDDFLVSRSVFIRLWLGRG